MHILTICRTCPRDGARDYALPAKLRSLFATEPGWKTMQVECLGSCREPAAVAFDAPDKWRLRFSGLAEADAPDLLAAARVYAGAPDGNPSDESLPEKLRRRLSARSPKRVAAAPGGAKMDKTPGRAP